MPTRPILQQDIPSLRALAQPVPEALFGTSELANIVREMEQALDKELDGVALAAPQIGIPYRIFIARFDRLLPETNELKEIDLGVFINPSFTRTSRRRIPMDEGCLSVRNIYGKTERHERATVKAQDASGAWFTRGGGGIVAQIYQHEIDHLDGVLFIDHAHALVHVSRRKEGEKTYYEETPIDPSAGDVLVPDVAE